MWNTLASAAEQEGWWITWVMFLVLEVLHQHYITYGKPAYKQCTLMNDANIVNH